MSNRSSSHKHGHAQVHILRKKSKIRNRKNKSLAGARRIERHAELNSVYKSALAKIA
jgi:hypothetical protein